MLFFLLIHHQTHHFQNVRPATSHYPNATQQTWRETSFCSHVTELNLFRIAGHVHLLPFLS